MPPRTSAARSSSRKSVAPKTVAPQKIPAIRKILPVSEPDTKDEFKFTQKAETRSVPKTNWEMPVVQEPVESQKLATKPSVSPGPDMGLKRSLMHVELAVSAASIVTAALFLASGLLFYLQSMELKTLSNEQPTAQSFAVKAQSDITNIQTQVDAIDTRLTNLESKGIVPATSTTTPTAVSSEGVPTETLPASKPVVSNASQTSPSGALVRGSLSPDGTKFAGYDVVTSGKKGVAVQVIGETRIRHIVLFNPATESSGLGLPEESSMSVRWLDNKTIEYDIILKKANGTQEKKVENVKVYF